MSCKPFEDFMLQEGLRQDSLIHNISAQLGTKNGLFMVFAAFVFTAESTLANMGGSFGLKLPVWGIGVPLLLSLAGITVLLRSAFLEKYRLPPILPALREQAERFFEFPDINGLSEEEKLARFQEKFINSLSRCVHDNFDVNARIANNLETASWLIGGSILSLFVSLFWVLGKTAVAFFRCL